MTSVSDLVPGQATAGSRQHTWEGDDASVWHCTTCGLVVQSQDTQFTCQDRPRPAPGRPGP